MKFSSMFLVLTLSLVLQACAPTGPIKFYQGPDKAKNDIATIKVPGPITIESVDGIEVRSPSKETGFYELHLLPGKHIVAFKYILYWGSDDAGMLIKSDLTAVDTEFEAGNVYELTYDKPKDEDEAFEFTKVFPATLVNLSSGEKTAAYEIDNLNAALFARQMQSNKPASTPAAAPTPVTTPGPKPAPMPSADQAVKEDPVKRLKFWWLMASEKERKAFSEWMKSVPADFAQ